MDDGRLLIVPTDKLITMKDQLGPSINQARAEGGASREAGAEN